MKKYLSNILKLLLLVIVGILIYISGILIINTIYDYRPETMPLEMAAPHNLPNMEMKSSFSMISWNIGYAGLGNNSDFFYDGGRMTRPVREDFDRYWNQILARVQTFDSLGFILLQELDTASSRSYGINQFSAIEHSLGSHRGSFAKIYDVKYVPMPLFNPMAKVVSGLATFSSFACSEVSQVAFPGNYAWPKRIFTPDRCFIQTVFNLPGEKKLFIINTHNSAFDDGSLRKNQLALLYDYMEKAFLDGHYVIAGGDWNMNPAGYHNMGFISGDPAFRLPGVGGVEGPDSNWSVVFDPDYPTNRELDAPYVPGKTRATIIDFYLCSPNINVLEVRTLYDGFRNADHQPVFIRFCLY